MSGKYIAVAGNMGAGKSSLVDFLFKAYGLKPFFESQDANPYLADFYRDMKVWAYHSQLYFLIKKFRHHLNLQRSSVVCSRTCGGEGGTQQALPVGGATRAPVIDRTIYEDAEIFATNLHRMRLISKRDYAIYWDLYQTILDVLEPPRVMIYLSCSMRTMRRRIGRRGREAESPIKTNYLRKLQGLYDRWIERYDRSPVIHLSTDRASATLRGGSAGSEPLAPGSAPLVPQVPESPTPAQVPRALRVASGGDYLDDFLVRAELDKQLRPYLS